MVETEAEVETIAAEDLDALLDTGDVIVVDVRTPYEYADGRIAGALNAPLTHFDPAAIPVEDDRETIFYCGTERRSAIAAEQMAEHWGMPVRHLAGGLAAWEEAGLEVVANSPDDDPRED